LFAIVTSLIVGLFSGLPRLALVFFMFGAAGGGPRGPMFILFFAIPVILMALMPLTLVVMLTPVIHGLLRLTGSTEFGLRRTYQAMCYSLGANSPSGIPCVGAYVGWIWWVVS